jgi:hypothetical protein
MAPGFRYASYPVTVDAGEQAEKLGFCDIDPALYGDWVDITHFAGEAILAAGRSGLSINGNVHVSQSYRLSAPIGLGEGLTIEGEVTALTPAPRGRMVDSSFRFRRPDSTVPLVADRESLRLDPAADGGGRKLGARPAEDPRSRMELLAVKQLRPEAVAAYSSQGGNLIHSDPATARRFGFRAPIAGGVMVSRYCMEALWRDGPVRELEMQVRFRRPMFWDERLEVWGRRGGNGRLKAINVVNADGKPAVTCQVARVLHDA